MRIKKSFLTFGLIAMAFPIFAQDLLYFNAGAFSVSTNTGFPPMFGGSGAGIAGPTTTTPDQFYYALLYQPSANPNGSYNGSLLLNPYVWDGSWLFTGIYSTNAPVLGRIFSSGPSLVVPWAQPQTNNIVLVGWSANLGSDWFTVSNLFANIAHGIGPAPSYGFFGESDFGALTPNTAPAPGAAVFANNPTPNGIPIDIVDGMTLYQIAIPEPSTLALTGLPGLSLWLFRNRKR